MVSQYSPVMDMIAPPTAANSTAATAQKRSDSSQFAQELSKAKAENASQETKTSTPEDASAASAKTTEQGNINTENPDGTGPNSVAGQNGAENTSGNTKAKTVTDNDITQNNSAAEPQSLENDQALGTKEASDQVLAEKLYHKPIVTMDAFPDHPDPQDHIAKLYASIAAKEAQTGLADQTNGSTEGTAEQGVEITSNADQAEGEPISASGKDGITANTGPSVDTKAEPAKADAKGTENSSAQSDVNAGEKASTVPQEGKPAAASSEAASPIVHKHIDDQPTDMAKANDDTPTSRQSQSDTVGASAQSAEGAEAPTIHSETKQDGTQSAQPDAHSDIAKSQTDNLDTLTASEEEGAITETNADTDTRSANGAEASNKDLANENGVSQAKAETRAPASTPQTTSQQAQTITLPANEVDQQSANQQEAVGSNGVTDKGLATSTDQQTHQTQPNGSSKTPDEQKLAHQTTAQNTKGNQAGEALDALNNANGKEVKDAPRADARDVQHPIETNTASGTNDRVKTDSNDPIRSAIHAPKGEVFSKILAQWQPQAALQDNDAASDTLFKSDLTSMPGSDPASVRLTGTEAFSRTGQMTQQSSLANSQALAAQISKFAQKGETRFEIRLDPADLGKVDVKLTIGSDGQARAHLFVERPETLDLMMRDQRMLERSLQQSGLNMDKNGVEFSLMDQQGQDQQLARGDQQNFTSGEQGKSGSDQSDTSLDAPEMAAAQTERYMASNGLNLII